MKCRTPSTDRSYTVSLKKWMAFKQPVIMLGWLGLNGAFNTDHIAEFQTNNITRYGNQLDFGQQC